MTTVYRDGDVSVTLSGDLEGWVRRAVEQAAGGVLDVLEREAGEVASRAKADWYNQVEKETGLSGQIGVRTVIDVGRGEVRVSVGSTDDRTAKNGKPLVVYVHRPRPDSLIRKKVDHRTYWDTPPQLRSKYPYILTKNPLTSDGKFLVPELLRKPMKARIAGLGPAIAAAVAQRVRA